MNWKGILITLVFSMVSWGTHAENLFVSLLGKNEEEVNERLQQVWKHFFTPSDLNRYEADDENLFITRDRMVQPLFWIQATTMCAPKGCRTV